MLIVWADQIWMQIMKADETEFYYETNLLGNKSVCHRSAETCKGHNELQRNQGENNFLYLFKCLWVLQIDICLIIT